MLNTLLSCKILIISTRLISLLYLNRYFNFCLAFSFQERVFGCLVCFVPTKSFIDVFLDITMQALQSVSYAEDLLQGLGKPKERYV